MKKLFFVLISFLCLGIGNLWAQYSVGDLYEEGDVKAIVFYVDESGEHGLAITLAREYTKEELKQAQKEAKAKMKAMTKEEKQELKMQKKTAAATLKRNNELAKGYYLDLESLTTMEGKENAQIIKQYCAERNIDMNIFFPNHCWAESLGEGWFIPGEKEAALYADFISFGVGEQNYKKISNAEVNNKYNALNTAIKSNSGYESCALPQYIQTSTIGRNRFFGTDFVIYKTFMLRKEQRGFGPFKHWVLFYDVNAYYPSASWLSTHNIAMRAF